MQTNKYRVVFYTRGSLYKAYYKTYAVALASFKNASNKKNVELQELDGGAYLTIERAGE